MSVCVCVLASKDRGPSGSCTFKKCKVTDSNEGLADTSAQALMAAGKTKAD